jgi:hypothetical protein
MCHTLFVPYVDACVVLHDRPALNVVVCAGFSDCKFSVTRTNQPDDVIINSKLSTLDSLPCAHGCDLHARTAADFEQGVCEKGVSAPCLRLVGAAKLYIYKKYPKFGVVCVKRAQLSQRPT